MKSSDAEAAETLLNRLLETVDEEDGSTSSIQTERDGGAADSGGIRPDEETDDAEIGDYLASLSERYGFSYSGTEGSPATRKAEEEAEESRAAAAPPLSAAAADKGEGASEPAAIRPAQFHPRSTAAEDAGAMDRMRVLANEATHDALSKHEFQSQVDQALSKFVCAGFAVVGLLIVTRFVPGAAVAITLFALGALLWTGQYVLLVRGVAKTLGPQPQKQGCSDSPDLLRSAQSNRL